MIWPIFSDEFGSRRTRPSEIISTKKRHTFIPTWYIVARVVVPTLTQSHYECFEVICSEHGGSSVVFDRLASSGPFRTLVFHLNVLYHSLGKTALPHSLLRCPAANPPPIARRTWICSKKQRRRKKGMWPQRAKAKTGSSGRRRKVARGGAAKRQRRRQRQHQRQRQGPRKSWAWGRRGRPVNPCHRSSGGGQLLLPMEAGWRERGTRGGSPWRDREALACWRGGGVGSRSGIAEANANGLSSTAESHE